MEKKIQIFFNWKKHMIPENSTLGTVVEEFWGDQKELIVVHNENAVKKELLHQVILKDQDVVEMMELIGGG